MIPGRPFCRTVGEKPGPRLQGPKASPEPRVDLCQTSFPRAMGFPYRCRVVCPGILCRHHRGRSVHAGTQGGGLCGQHLLLRKVAQSLETAPPWWRPHLLRAHFSGPNFFFFFLFQKLPDAGSTILASQLPPKTEANQQKLKFSFKTGTWAQPQSRHSMGLGGLADERRCRQWPHRLCTTPLSQVGGAGRLKHVRGPPGEATVLGDSPREL